MKERKMSSSVDSLRKNNAQIFIIFLRDVLQMNQRFWRRRTWIVMVFLWEEAPTLTPSHWPQSQPSPLMCPTKGKYTTHFLFNFNYCSLNLPDYKILWLRSENLQIQTRHKDGAQLWTTSRLPGKDFFFHFKLLMNIYWCK